MLQPYMKLSLAYPVAGTQKLIEIDDDAKLYVTCPPRLSVLGAAVFLCPAVATGL